LVLSRVLRNAKVGAVLLVSAVLLAEGCASAPPRQTSSSVASAAPAARSVVDGVFTKRQAARGGRSFERFCSACHRTREFRGTVFQLAWTGRVVGDLLQLLVDTMPPDDPGSLGTEDYTDVLTYLLQLNGYPAGEEELPADLSVLMDVRFGI